MRVPSPVLVNVCAHVPVPAVSADALGAETTERVESVKTKVRRRIMNRCAICAMSIFSALNLITTINFGSSSKKPDILKWFFGLFVLS